MRAGTLDRRITLQRATITRNAMGEGVETWADLATVPAAKADVSDRERIQSAEVAAEITTRFRIRWSPTVSTLNPKDRLTCEGRTYEIWGVKETGRRAELEISATARADA